MKTRFEVLSQSEVERICIASFGILAEVGIKCEYAKAQELFRQAGAQVDENSHAVRIPEHLGRWALENALKNIASTATILVFTAKSAARCRC